jgi:hypothetical protein
MPGEMMPQAPVPVPQATYEAVQRVWQGYQFRLRRFTVVGGMVALGVLLFRRSIPLGPNMFALVLVLLAAPCVAWMMFLNHRDCRREGALCPTCGSPLLGRKQVEWNAFPGGLRGTCDYCKSVLQWTEAQRPLAPHLKVASGTHQRARWATWIAWVCVLPGMTLFYWLAHTASAWGPRYYPLMPWRHPFWGFVLGMMFFGLILAAYWPINRIMKSLGRAWGVCCPSCNAPLAGWEAQPWHRFEDHEETVCSVCGSSIDSPLLS